MKWLAWDGQTDDEVPRSRDAVEQRREYSQSGRCRSNPMVSAKPGQAPSQGGVDGVLNAIGIVRSSRWARPVHRHLDRLRRGLQSLQPVRGVGLTLRRRQKFSLD